jgi:ABC-type sugar transport system ATPase subunit
MEAMSLGDRIAIINEGKVVQIGTGDEIYYMPCNEFVSQLMGDPEINLIPATIEKDGDKLKAVMECLGTTYELPADADVYGTFTDEAKKVDVGVRPQHIKYAFEPTEGYIKCTVYSYESIGNKSVIVAEKDGMFLRMIAPNGLSIKIDQDVYVDMQIDQTMFFDAETKDYLTRYNEAAVKALVAELEA